MLDRKSGRPVLLLEVNFAGLHASGRRLAVALLSWNRGLIVPGPWPYCPESVAPLSRVRGPVVLGLWPYCTLDVAILFSGRGLIVPPAWPNCRQSWLYCPDLREKNVHPLHAHVILPRICAVASQYRHSVC